MIATASGLALAAVVWRFLTFDGFSNDHYAHLALAQQMLLGARPVRDFYDPGWPLMYLLSAAAWGLIGHAMATEWALTAAAFAAAAACTAVVAYRLSLSLRIALVVTVLEILIYPRTYAYPKVLVYAIGAWAIVAVAAKPSARRVWLMAGIVAASFLFRHDHGLFLGLASALVVVAASHAEGWPMAGRRLGLLVAAVSVFLLPWIVFVALHGGLVEYFAGGLEFARGEAGGSMLRKWPALFTMSPDGPKHIGDYLAGLNADSWLFWLFWALPVVCGAIVCRRIVTKSERWPGELAAVSALILLAVLVNGGFLRDVLQTRVPDAVVPAALLGAWSLGACWTGHWRHPALQAAVQITAIAVLSLSAHAVGRIGRVPDRVSDIGVADGLEGVGERAAFVYSLLASPHRQSVYPPSRFSEALLPFFSYLDRCTSRDDRLIVTGEFPDVLVLTGRGFAGNGVVFGAWYSSRTHQDRSIARVAAQSAPFALLIGDGSDFHVLQAHLEQNYEPMTEVRVDGADSVRVLVERTRRALRIDPETGWRCFQ